jgi:hypothetical protein
MRYPSHEQRGVPSQRGMSFVRNYLKATKACDFFVPGTIRFQVIYVFVMMEVGIRRIVHFNVSSNPASAQVMLVRWKQLWLFHKKKKGSIK